MELDSTFDGYCLNDVTNVPKMIRENFKVITGDGWPCGTTELFRLFLPSYVSQHFLSKDGSREGGDGGDRPPFPTRSLDLAIFRKTTFHPQISHLSTTTLKFDLNLDYL
jgi:hypothetical protein